MPRSRQLDLLGSLALAALSAGACSLDHRRLDLAPGDAHQGAAGGGEVDELVAGASVGGSSGSPADGLVDGCADLDTDGIADCSATLLDNPSFTSDVSGWQAASDTELTWAARNALDDQPSGSARLKSSAALASVAQCVLVKGEQLVIAYANAFVEADPESDEPVRAELEVSFFDNDDCSGERGAYFETPASMTAGAWTVVQAGGIAAASTGSVSIALLGFKSPGPSESELYFDNVMLKLKPLE